MLDPKLNAYLDALAASTDPIQSEMEALAKKDGFPIVGPQVGALLRVLALTAGAKRVLELGSGFGYSALWFARAVGTYTGAPLLVGLAVVGVIAPLVLQPQFLAFALVRHLSRSAGASWPRAVPSTLWPRSMRWSVWRGWCEW